MKKIILLMKLMSLLMKIMILLMKIVILVTIAFAFNPDFVLHCVIYEDF